MQGLHILQYNAGKNAGMQQTLLANPKMQDYDFIVLQEPSHNSQTGGTHCSREVAFGQYMRLGGDAPGWHFYLTRG